MTKTVLHAYVQGKVQGVWFRDSTKKQAERLGITGWVCNLPDGRVEVLACGEVAAIEQLHVWLKHGPPLAEVEEVIVEMLPWQVHVTFVIL